MKTALLLSLTFGASLALVGCTSNTDSTKAETPPPALDSPHFLREEVNGEKLVIYQMMTRLFGNQTATNQEYGSMAVNGVGQFGDITATALQELRELGATHIWYTGVLEHATMIDQREWGIPLDDADVVKGRAGSPYAIKDYYDVNAYMAQEPANRMAEFEALVARTHAAGLKVLIDFVPNHVARSYASDAKPEGVVDFGADDDVTQAFSPTNNYYYLPGQAFVVPSEHTPGGPNTLPTEDGKFAEFPAKATGNDGFTATPQNWDWFETVKLNYGVEYQNNRIPHFDPVPDTWHKMLHILQYWAGKGVDGVRCDMAEMVPVEFWEWVIPQVKAQAGQEFTFIAEIYNPAQYGNYLDRGQFDYLYDKVQLYDSLKHVIQGKTSAAGISTIWKALEGYNGRMLRFLENHDEQRIASPGFAGNAWKGLPMMVVSATMHTGPVLVYFGQEVGEPGEGKEGFQGEDGRTTIFDFWGVPQHQKWMNGGAFDGGQLDESSQQLRGYYQQLLQFTRSSAVLAQGDFFDLSGGNTLPRSAYSFLRHSEEGSLLVVTNMGAEPIETTIRIPEEVRES
ncbi:MAG: alpha-amylase family protein, partial [Bacteroidota bacterium]